MKFIPVGISEIKDYEISYGYDIYFVYRGINFISFLHKQKFHNF